MAATCNERVERLRSVFRIVPLGSMKLKTVELRSNASKAPESDILPTIASTSPWEKTVGAGPGSTCEPRKFEVIWPLGKYCTITLFRFRSDMAELSAVSIDCVSETRQDSAPPT